jgi:formamidopyrimidine-DNA glycosylase
LRIPFPENFREAIKSKRINTVSRRAKYLLFELEDSQLIIAHLGMSGSFRVLNDIPNETQKHDHVMMTLSPRKTLIYHDPRRFGLITLGHKETLHEHVLFKDIGPEPFSQDFSPEYLVEALSKRKTAIKPTLLDQKLVAGVGNIYASEALFRCNIHPETPSYHITDRACDLVIAIQDVLKAAVKSGGSTLRNYIQTTGENGYFQHQFNVYDRGGESCFVCGCTIEKIIQSARTTYFCPSCQCKEKNTKKRKKSA